MAKITESTNLMPAESKKTFIKNINRRYITNFSQLQDRKRLFQELGDNHVNDYC